MPQLVIIAIATGLFTGFVILLFRAAVDYTLRSLLGDSEAFEALAHAERLALPIAGALFIGIALNRMAPSVTRVGVVHVMERLSRHQGYLPVRNALVQFFAGIVALISGQSGGREGPAIHLGAASASILGHAFELPNNSMRTLVACGTAAAVASSFNTPVAGVIFAMEVVMMEYTIGSFIPIIVAAVTSTFLTHYFLGNEAALTVAPIEIRSLLEIPFIMLAGVVIACLATAFIMLTQQFARLGEWPFWARAIGRYRHRVRGDHRPRGDGHWLRYGQRCNVGRADDRHADRRRRFEIADQCGRGGPRLTRRSHRTDAGDWRLRGGRHGLSRQPIPA